MKNIKDFDKLMPVFSGYINGKSGDDFAVALLKFSCDNNFEYNVVRNIFKCDKFEVLFITDNPNNKCGIVFFELYGIKSFGFTSTLDEARLFIFDYCMELLKRNQKF